MSVTAHIQNQTSIVLLSSYYNKQWKVSHFLKNAQIQSRKSNNMGNVITEQV